MGVVLGSSPWGPAKVLVLCLKFSFTTRVGPSRFQRVFVNQFYSKVLQDRI